MTTSPVTTNNPITIQESPDPQTIGEEWRAIATFLRRPKLDAGRSHASPMAMLVRVYLLDMMAMLGLMAVAGIVVAMGVELPQTAIAEMDITWGLALAAIVGAPLAEEIAFRSWLSGKRSHILALLFALAGLGAVVALHQSAPIMAALLGLAGLVAVIAALIIWRRDAPMGWFVRAFPAFFWLATISFGLVHLANFEDASWLLLPLVLPQLIVGALLGYVRVRIGLWAAILLHATHNATALGLASLAMGGVTAS